VALKRASLIASSNKYFCNFKLVKNKIMERPSSIKKAKLPPIPPGGDIKARFE